MSHEPREQCHLSTDILHLMTSSDFNAFTLKSFSCLALVQVDFAGTRMFCAPSCFRVFDEVKM